jgi:DNA modification methylase/DNA-directed RNA polymerase subunit RPC12/RpoP
MQQELFNSQIATRNSKPQPVTCLGIEFPSDEARRQHFTELLRERLRDPEFRKIEGFPIGSDEDILNLSDPPYYTACPNPWIADFIAEWEAQKPEQPEGYHYHREPFAADVSEGKNDPIYNAHSYHTKVPHKAIMRYILHYTQPGDIVFDGFCGTGMTGVAAQMCGDRETVMSLGYHVKPDGTILQEEKDEDGKKVWRPFSKLGVRRAVLNDLSPSATSISKMYNSSLDHNIVKKEASKVIEELKKQIVWLYKTKDPETGKECQVTSTIWSDVYYCPDCNGEIVFWDVAVDTEKKEVRAEITCPTCGKSELRKGDLERAHETVFDPFRQESRTVAKRRAVLIEYEFTKGRRTKEPDDDDIALLKSVAAKKMNLFVPNYRIDRDIDLWYERDYRALGVDNVLDFFTIRAVCSISTFRHLSNKLASPNTRDVLNWVLTAVTEGSSLMNRERPGGMPSKLSGTLYIGALIREINPISFIERKFKKFLALNLPQLRASVTSTQSMTGLGAIDDACLDYVFIDPPFGSNIIYSDLSILWEAWIDIFTNTRSEAVVHRRKKQAPNTLREYMGLMTASFQEAYRVLKPGRWMTVEFSNTKASVWNSIQVALTEAGFIVANVSALDKKQGSFKAVTTPTAVKQDLVISAYKPNGGFEERFQQEAQTEEGVWDFVRTHLKYLPVTKQQGALLQFVPERDPRILFDQMVAYYVRKGYPVPTSSQEFQIGLAQRFIERDGMYFLPDQVAEYDRKKMTSGELKQMSLFVSDEASAIQWLRQLIKEKPQTFADINPQFMQQLGGWSKNEAQLDLRELLNQNFLSYDGKGPVPEQIHAYLSTNWKELRNLPKDDPTLVAKARDRWYVPDPNKAGDLEKLREKALLKEFEEYKQVKKKLKVFRLEAVRAGFKKAWQERDYAVIVAVADKIPNNVLEEDPKLLMWYDQAVTRMGGES